MKDYKWTFSDDKLSKSRARNFLETSGISYCSKTCSSRPGLSIAPTLVRFGHVQTIKDTIKKWILKAPEAPLKKLTYLRPSELQLVRTLGEKAKCVTTFNVFHTCWCPRYIRSFSTLLLPWKVIYWSFKNYSSDFEFYMCVR